MFINFNNDIRYQILDKKTESTLMCRYKMLNDLSARSLLITSHLRLVYKVSKRYISINDSRFTDFFQEGSLGLMYALELYKNDSRARFSTYAIHWIECYIKKYMLESCTGIKISLTNKNKKLLYSAMREFKNNISFDFYDSSKHNVVNAVFNSNEFLKNIYNTNQEVENDAIENHKISNIKSIIKSTLNQREQEIVQYRYDHECTLKDIGLKMHVSPERVRQLIIAIHNKLMPVIRSQR